MPRERSRKTCENCRVSRTGASSFCRGLPFRELRAACYTGPNYNCCYRCDAKGLAVSDAGPARRREDNETSELRSQILRFEAVLDSLHRRLMDSDSAEEPVASTSQQTLDAGQADGCIEVQDLIGALTALCFRPDGVDRNLSTNLDRNELLKEAEVLLSGHEDDVLHDLRNGGFTFDSASSQLSLQELQGALPPAEEVIWLLEDVYMSSWTRGLYLLFHPVWPIKVRRLLRPSSAPPLPHELAELFGALAVATAVLATGRDASRAERIKWQRHADRYAELLAQALVLGRYAEDPTIEAARALCLLALLHLCCSDSTSRIRHGLAVLAVAKAMLDQLGFHAPESDFVGRETAEEQWNRRAVVNAVLALDVKYNRSFGRQVVSAYSSWQVDFPVDPSDEDLPSEARASCFRLPPELLHSHRAIYRAARLQQEILCHVFPTPTGVVYSKVRDYAVKIDELWQDTVLPGCGLVDDPKTGLRIFQSQRDSTPMPLDVRIARMFVLGTLLRLKMMLHRPFVHPDAMAVDAAVDYTWHRNAVLAISRDFMPVYVDAGDLMGPFTAMAATGFDAILGICMLIFSDPDMPQVEKHRYELSKGINYMVESPVAPTAVRRLARIAAFLLDKPKVRAAEQRAEDDSSQTEVKRRRKGRFEQDCEAPPSVLGRAKRSDRNDFLFQLESSLPQSSMSAFEANFSKAANTSLRHKWPAGQAPRPLSLAPVMQATSSAEIAAGSLDGRVATLDS